MPGSMGNESQEGSFYMTEATHRAVVARSGPCSGSLLPEWRTDFETQNKQTVV